MASRRGQLHCLFLLCILFKNCEIYISTVWGFLPLTMVGMFKWFSSLTLFNAEIVLVVTVHR